LQLLSFAHRQSKKVARVNADPRVDSGDSHAPVPFFVTTMGLGILVDTARYATFYFGDARPKPLTPGVLTNHLNPDGTWDLNGNADPNESANLRDSDNGEIIVEVPSASGVTVYLFAGPTMLGAVQRYNIFSGGGFVPPEWGLGFWYRAELSTEQATVLELAREFRAHRIPFDVIGLEPGWQTHAYSCTYAWNKKRFPEPARLIADLGDMHFQLNLWEHAFVHPASEIFSSLRDHAGSYGVWGGLVPDFAGREAREAFTNYHGKTLVDLGVSGFKLDECDNSDFTGGWSFPESSSFPSGLDGEQMHSVFGLYYQHSILESYRRRGKATYGLVRNSGALAAPYPFVLYSDLYSHRDYIRALVNSGFSGLLWCPEVRDAASVEDLIRRLQSAAFSPLAQVDAWFIKNPPWKQIDQKKNNRDELMDGWQQVEAQCREIIGWRMQLAPYLTAAFQRYAELGIPPFRALVLDYPECKEVRTVDDEYIVGDRMVVAPLFAAEAERKIVLPPGRWHDFWTGATVQGTTEFSVPSSTSKIPVYVKSGSIVPWADVGQFAGDPAARQLTARVYGHGSIPFRTGLGGESIELQWKDGKGAVIGRMRQPTGYVVRAWQQIL
jgi:alpha-D-xyloside xylohydrolase